ncbi:hypothetical protein [Paraburkholderia translucens]
MSNREKHPHSNRSEQQIDEAVENTFPASDAPSTGGSTRIEDDGNESHDEAPEQHDDKRARRRSSHGSH